MLWWYRGKERRGEKADGVDGRGGEDVDGVMS